MSSTRFNLGLTGKKVFVTGSTAGIGFGCALQFAKEGCTVYVNGRSASKVAESIERLKQQAGDSGATYVSVVGDLSKAEETKQVIDVLPDDLDVLVCNIGIYGVKDFADVTDEEWQQYFDANIMSTVRVCRHFLPKMLSRNSGRIIIISSESGFKAHPYMVHYSMTKAAQISIARGMAELTKGTKVTVNTVLPGPTETEGLQEYFKGVAIKQNVSYEQAIGDYFKTVEPSSLIQRLIKVEEVAAVVVFLASEHAGAINGAAQRVEGGILRYL